MPEITVAVFTVGNIQGVTERCSQIEGKRMRERERKERKKIKREKGKEKERK